MRELAALQVDSQGYGYREDSEFQAVLNEGNIPEAALIELPAPVRVELFPKGLREQREHPDVRLARRARTIANLARIISERKVKVGIRRTLWAQARRLELLARRRLEELERNASRSRAKRTSSSI